MSGFHYTATDEAGTAALARAVASVLPRSMVIALIGTLGAGKTRFVQALAQAAGIDESAVLSPTFVLVQEYPGPQTIYHFDAYRLKDEDEFRELGCDEYFAAAAWSVVEWADRVMDCLPDDRLVIRIEVTGPSERRFEISGTGPESEKVVDRLLESSSGS